LNTFENFTGNVAAAAAGRKAFEEQRQQLGEKLLKYLLRNIPSIDWLGSYSEDQIQTNLKTRNKQSSHKFSTQKYVFACSRLHPGGVCV
jgi:predicted transcriptional regulator of viral defense system